MIEHANLIRQLGSILIIFFGLIITGVLNFNFLMKERKLKFKNRPSGFLDSTLIGMAFGAGWTPCNGPIIGAIFAMSASAPNDALMLMVIYCLGFAIPFFILSFFRISYTLDAEILEYDYESWWDHHDINGCTSVF